MSGPGESGNWEAVAAEHLPDRLADWLADSAGPLRVAIDGPPAARPDDLAESLIEPLRTRSRPVLHVRAQDFWRDAALRLEYGHEDVLSYPGWLDVDALRREVLVPLHDGRPVLTSLRDPLTNRSTREPPRLPAPGTVLLVSGPLLLGHGLPFERTVHLLLPAEARARRTPAADAWTLPAFDSYDDDVDPARTADVVVRLGRRTPAVRVRS